MSGLTDDQKNAIGAIYADARQRGYRLGFEAGVDEKKWLHKVWPLVGILLFAAGTVFGFVMGWVA